MVQNLEGFVDEQSIAHRSSGEPDHSREHCHLIDLMKVSLMTVHLMQVRVLIDRQTPAERFETFFKTVNHQHTFSGADTVGR